MLKIVIYPKKRCYPPTYPLPETVMNWRARRGFYEDGSGREFSKWPEKIRRGSANKHTWIELDVSTGDFCPESHFPKITI